MLIFDIETGPDVQRLNDQFSSIDWEAAFPKPGEFDESTVKYGNAKKEDTRAPILAAAKAAHAELLQNYPLKLEEFQAARWDEMYDKAPLDPVLGVVLAVGLKTHDNEEILHVANYGTIGERAMLAHAWEIFGSKRDQANKIIGVNILDFDLPFLVRRSWILGVDVPEWVRKGRYFDSSFVDLEVEWNMGNNAKCISADNLCKALGIVGKEAVPEVTGATFHTFYNGTPEQREKALAYLSNDLRMEWEIAERMQF
jgi:predicted PolB exonuclease-like 3'-5' exonuclease